jgi:hypothetical protein
MGKKPTAKKPDSFDIYTQAWRVLNSAKLVGMAAVARVAFHHDAQGRPTGGSSHFNIPSQFLFVFSAELFLKCLLAVRGRQYERVHRLKRDLFNKLPLADRRKARQYFDEMAADDADMKFAKDHAGIDLTFDLVLSSCETVFQTFRYWYEYKGELFQKVRGRQSTQGTWGIHLVVAALERLVIETPGCADWAERVDVTGMIKKGRPVQPGKRISVYSPNGGILTYVPKKDAMWPPTVDGTSKGPR